MKPHVIAISVFLLQPVIAFAAKPIIQPEDQPRAAASSTDARPQRAGPGNPARVQDAKAADTNPRRAIEPEDRSRRRTSPRAGVQPEDSPRRIIEPTDRPRGVIEPQDRSRGIIQPSDRLRGGIEPQDRRRGIIEPQDLQREPIGPKQKVRESIIGPNNRPRATDDVEAPRVRPTPDALRAIEGGSFGAPGFTASETVTRARDRWRALAEELAIGLVGSCMASVAGPGRVGSAEESAGAAANGCPVPSPMRSEP